MTRGALEKLFVETCCIDFFKLPLSLLFQETCEKKAVKSSSDMKMGSKKSKAVFPKQMDTKRIRLMTNVVYAIHLKEAV